VFVAIDAIGVVPIYLGLAEGVREQVRRQVIWQALATALILCIFFLFLGRAVFQLLGITLYDFMVAGGAVLFAISIRDLLEDERHGRTPHGFGVVPLGTPLIAGPALLTTTLMMAQSQGTVVTLAAIVANLVLVGLVLAFSKKLFSLLGLDGARAASKVSHLLLAAIAVMMVRRGIMGMMGR
jgi:multiple antibiotic resistance protein